MARKYKRGDKISSIQEFSEQTLIWWQGKVYHCGFLFSWQFMLILAQLQAGHFYKVEPIEKEDRN